MGIFTKRKNIKLEKNILKKELLLKCLFFVIGAFISALSFNLFYVPNNFVSGGLGGIAVILSNIINLDVNTIILIGNIIFIILSIIFIGFKESIMGIVGALTYIIFVNITQDIAVVLNFSFDDVLLYVLAAGFVGGFGEALVYKAGFNTGGTSIPALILQKKTKMPLGKLLRVISLSIIFIGGLRFGYTSIMYSLIISTISTSLVDKILIGTSYSKTVFIKTTKEKEIKSFILDIIKCGVTEIDTKGSFTHMNQKMLMCVVPTEKYSLLKNSIEEIDPSAFVVVSDCYEVMGGTKKRIIDLD